MLCGLGAAFTASAAETPTGNTAPNVLALHAVPVYTDFSQLNSNPAQMEQAYRHRAYRAYRPIEDLSRRLKIANYSGFENPTASPLRRATPSKCAWKAIRARRWS